MVDKSMKRWIIIFAIVEALVLGTIIIYTFFFKK